MRRWIAFWNILAKDMRAYYLKPPNISWGLIFPLAWTAMFFIKSGASLGSVRGLLPGVVTLSVLFGTTSMLAVTVTFEKKGRSFERLLLAPIPLELLMLAKTSGAILFGVANGFVPIVMAMFLTDLSGVNWLTVVPAVVLIAVVSTFLGLLIAVSVREVFEAQTFSNFFRFPMIFLCGLFFPIGKLPVFLRPLSYALPLTYGADLLHAGFRQQRWISLWLDLLHAGFRQQRWISLWLDFVLLSAFCLGLFLFSLRSIRKKWIL